MANLRFGKSVSLKAFKAEQSISTIEVIRSPKTGRHFFTCDGTTAGAVSESALGATADELSVTEVTGDDGDFLLMHKRSSNNVVASY